VVDCFVCRKHRGELEMPGGTIYQDELVHVSHGEMKRDALAYPGVLFVEPKRHVPTLAELTRAESERIGWLSSVLSRALLGEGAERTYLAVLGHHVPHLHVWIVPRYPGTPDELFGVGVLQWQEAPRKPWQEIAGLCARVSGHVRRELIEQR
jgi:histidine triad (HIT) family protein